MRLLAVRVVTVLAALTWLLLPGFGLPDLAVSFDPDSRAPSPRPSSR